MILVQSAVMLTNKLLIYRRKYLAFSEVNDSVKATSGQAGMGKNTSFISVQDTKK